MIIAICACALVLQMQAAGSAFHRNLWSRQIAPILLQPTSQGTALQLIPTEHPRFATLQASLSLRQGRADVAIATLEQAASENKLEALESGLLATSLQENGQVERAAQIWHTLGDYQSLIRTGLTAQQKQEFSDAVLAFRFAWELDALATTSHLAEALIANQSSIEAERLLYHTLENYPERPEADSWRMILAMLLMQQDRCAEAIPVLEAQSHSCGECRIRLGQALYCAGADFDTAKAEIEAGIALSPKFYLGYFALGRIYANEGQYSEAENWFGQALAFSPQDQWAWIARAENALLISDPALAIRTLQEAESHFAGSASLYVVLARAFRQADDTTGTVTAIESAIRLDPTADTWLLAGQIYEWVQDPERAASAYEEALHAEPSNQAARDGLMRTGKLEEQAP